MVNRIKRGITLKLVKDNANKKILDGLFFSRKARTIWSPSITSSRDNYLLLFQFTSKNLMVETTEILLDFGDE